MKEFRFGYADGYIGSPLKLSDDSLTLIGIRRGIERPNKVIVNFMTNTKYFIFSVKKILLQFYKLKD